MHALLLAVKQGSDMPLSKRHSKANVNAVAVKSIPQSVHSFDQMMAGTMCACVCVCVCVCVYVCVRVCDFVLCSIHTLTYTHKHTHTHSEFAHTVDGSVAVALVAMFVYSYDNELGLKFLCRICHHLGAGCVHVYDVHYVFVYVC